MRHKLSIHITVFLGLCPLLFVCCHEFKGHEALIQEYCSGTELYFAGMYKDALEVFKSVCRKDPAFFPASLAAGKAAFLSGSFKEAETFLLSAVKLEPKSIDARKWLARLYVSQSIPSVKTLMAAEENLYAAFETSSEDPEIIMLIGQAKEKQGKLDEALGYYRQAAALRSRLAELSLSLASVYVSYGFVQEAAKELDIAGALVPEDERFLNAIKTCKNETGETR